MTASAISTLTAWKGTERRASFSRQASRDPNFCTNQAFMMQLSETNYAPQVHMPGPQLWPPNAGVYYHNYSLTVSRTRRTIPRDFWLALEKAWDSTPRPFLFRAPIDYDGKFLRSVGTD